MVFSFKQITIKTSGCLLSLSIGCGKFCKIDVIDALTGRASLFEWCEIRTVNELTPHLVISDSNVLWYLMETCDVLQSTALYYQ